MNSSGKNMRAAGHSLWILILLALGLSDMSAVSAAASDTADKSRRTGDTAEKSTSVEPYSGMKWREVGPYRGGRSAAITGVASDPMLYYFGATGGGVWKTNDAGGSWNNISDGFFGGSI
jgi:hypothetical protein